MEVLENTMNNRQKHAHMEATKVYAGLSYCERLKVGAIIVKDHRVVSIGYNGTPAGECNTCEENNVTKPSVIHAEDNALRKLKDKSEDLSDAVMFITHAPCVPCAQMIHDASIRHVVYEIDYRDRNGVAKLHELGITVDKLEPL